MGARGLRGAGASNCSGAIVAAGTQWAAAVHCGHSPLAVRRRTKAQNSFSQVRLRFAGSPSPWEDRSRRRGGSGAGAQLVTGKAAARWVLCCNGLAMPAPGGRCSLVVCITSVPRPASCPAPCLATCPAAASPAGQHTAPLRRRRRSTRVRPHCAQGQLIIGRCQSSILDSPNTTLATGAEFPAQRRRRRRPVSVAPRPAAW